MKGMLTHYQTKNFRHFQTERVCRLQFQINENGRKLSNWVENTVGKGEIARYEPFLLFPRCFQKACFPGASKGVIMWEWVKFCLQIMGVFFYKYWHIEKIHVITGENSCYIICQHCTGLCL